MYRLYITIRRYHRWRQWDIGETYGNFFGSRTVRLSFLELKRLLYFCGVAMAVCCFYFENSSLLNKNVLASDVSIKSKTKFILLGRL